jgi:rhamnulokinase
MPESLRLAAIDLGAESGRVVLGGFDGKRVTLDVVHRFANRPVWLPDGLHWNLPALFTESLTGLGIAARVGELDGIGIDAWGCDYGLLDGRGRILGLPYHYRDGRVTDAVTAQAFACVGRDELYARTGIQTLPINTIFQLVADGGAPGTGCAQRIALVPDLFGLWLTGELVNERTIASTTGLLDARTGGWALDLIARLGLPERPFAHEVLEPGTEIGRVLRGHADTAGAAVNAVVRAVGGHDTASAFAAAPIAGPACAVLSSGTWSLLGVELDQAELGPDAAAANLTNERGVEQTVRLLRNVMGLWLVQECRRAIQAGGSGAGAPATYETLVALAARARPDVPVFDPDDPTLLHPASDMPARIAALCTAAGQPAPDGPGELVRSILVSLACAYRRVLECLEAVSDRHIETIHIVGGGARNALLCALTAQITGRPVLAGPVEATALGNVLTQAIAAGELSGLAELREVVARSVALHRHDPAPAGAAEADEIYDRFRQVAAGSALPQSPTPA